MCNILDRAHHQNGYQEEYESDGVAMSVDGLGAVVSGVDLALVSWMDGPVVDLSSVTGQARPHQHQRIGRCLCAKEDHHQQQSESDSVAHQHHNNQQPNKQQDATRASTLPLPLKPTLKKPQQQQQQQQRPAVSSTSFSESIASVKASSIDRHIVPQVVEVVSQRTRQPPELTVSMGCNSVDRIRFNRQQSVAAAKEIGDPAQRTQQQQQDPTPLVANKPILSRKNWNNTIDVSGVGAGSSASQQHHHQHQPSCLRRYGSQQSCKSATTLRSYVTSTSRGNL